MYEVLTLYSYEPKRLYILTINALIDVPFEMLSFFYCDLVKSHQSMTVELLELSYQDLQR